jgi:hypothetical protein
MGLGMSKRIPKVGEVWKWVSTDGRFTSDRVISIVPYCEEKTSYLTETKILESNHKSYMVGTQQILSIDTSDFEDLWVFCPIYDTPLYKAILGEDDETT